MVEIQSLRPQEKKLIAEIGAALKMVRPMQSAETASHKLQCCWDSLQSRLVPVEPHITH